MLTATVLNSLAATILSLAFTYVPGLNKKYDALDQTYKRLIMLGLLVIITGAIFGMSCAGWLQYFGDYAVACTEQGAVNMLVMFFTALGANQATYLISPKPAALTDPEPQG